MPENKIEQIQYCEDRDRLIFCGEDLHCGDGLQVLLSDGLWHAVSFEYSDYAARPTHWYIPGFRGVSPVGLWAQKLTNA